MSTANTDTARILHEHRLKALRLPIFPREYDGRDGERDRKWL